MKPSLLEAKTTGILKGEKFLKMHRLDSISSNHVAKASYSFSVSGYRGAVNISKVDQEPEVEVVTGVRGECRGCLGVKCGTVWLQDLGDQEGGLCRGRPPCTWWRRRDCQHAWVYNRIQKI